METTEVVPNDEEHAEWFPRVFHLGEEVGCETERQGDLCRLIKVCFEDVLVEDQETLENLQLVFVGDRSPDFVVELLIG